MDNAAISRHRSSQTHQKRVDRSRGVRTTPPPDEYEQVEFDLIVDSVLESAPREHAIAVRLSIYDQLGPTEIATHMANFYGITMTRVGWFKLVRRWRERIARTVQAANAV